MNKTHSEVVEKLMEITKLKKELFHLLLPEQTSKHLEVIGDELKAMVMETICGAEKTSEHKTSVKKVTID